ncbi:Biotin/lipoate A/B protein ligase, partial [Serendipita sp. 398]
LFRKASANRPLLLLYRNEPCVVIGRNQNPWKEINQTALRQANVPFIRRRSGGGTVYHDMGNTNFSLHLPRTSFERRKGSELAVEALKKLKVPDVWETMVGRSVASVRSPVRNIVEFKPDVTHESFSKALCAAFCEKFGAEIKVVEIGEEIMEKNAFAAERDFIEKSATELESWEWKYGQTLEFTHVIESTANERQLYANIVAKHGIITSCRLTMDGKEDGLQSLCADLVGKRYGMLQDSEFNIGTPELDVLHWLQHEM